MTFGAVGVVFGDIGTSPLYAFRESLNFAGGRSPDIVLGILSLIIWSLIIIVTFKYVLLLMRADNNGEGGILSLMALTQAVAKKKGGWVVTLGICGAALFYGDAMITPAISVLSAVEGLSLVTNVMTPYVHALALTILFFLFAFQRFGTDKVARLFGPIMLVWFAALAWGGLMHIQDTPVVLGAFNPRYGIDFLLDYKWQGFLTLGGVFLAVTGAEALYADLGHFGKNPIRLGWMALVMPALLLNYFGQAALVISQPEMADNPFFMLYPEWALLPMVMLSTMATVIASQAVISGAFSLTHQAIQMGLLPRMEVRFTSAGKQGQIYMPRVNWLLLAGVVLLIEMFNSSSNLASAYGIAVTGTMVITALLTFLLMREYWKWPFVGALLITGPLFIIDSLFLASNLTKIFEGGIFPLLIAVALIVMMHIWVQGTRTLRRQAQDNQLSTEKMIEEMHRVNPKHVNGTAVYLSGNMVHAPEALLHNLKHNKVLHEHNILMTFTFTHLPYVSDSERIEVVEVAEHFTRVIVLMGYMETPKVTVALRLLREKGLKLDLMLTTFFISRRNIVHSPNFGMPLWKDKIFISMTKFASDATTYFHIPPSRVVEIGMQMTI